MERSNNEGNDTMSNAIDKAAEIISLYNSNMIGLDREEAIRIAHSIMGSMDKILTAIEDMGCSDSADYTAAKNVHDSATMVYINSL